VVRPLGFEGGSVGDLGKFHRPNVCLSSAAFFPFFVSLKASLGRSKKHEPKNPKMPILWHNFTPRCKERTKRRESYEKASPKTRRCQLHCLWKRPHLQGWAVFLKQGRRLSALFMLPLWNSIFQTRYVEIECDESRSQVSSMWEYQTLEKCTPSHAVRRKKTALYMPRVRFEFYREVNSLFPLFFILPTWRFLF
jgi:hypothetical protein